MAALGLIEALGEIDKLIEALGLKDALGETDQL
jgi:hypothetical protein